MKSNHKNFVHLVGSYTYCRMMHGAYNVKKWFSKLYVCVCAYLFIYLLNNLITQPESRMHPHYAVYYTIQRH